MTKLLQQIARKLKKSWYLIAICFVIIVGSELALLNHYRHLGAKKVFGTDDLIYLIEAKLLDLKFKSRGPDKSPTKVGILAIDQKSLVQFGRFPFSRSYYGQAFANLKKLGVKWIGFDVTFSEPERAMIEDFSRQMESLNPQNIEPAKVLFRSMLETSPGDKSLALAIKEFENIVLGFMYYQQSWEAKEYSRNKENPFEGFDDIAGSAIQGLIMPEGKQLSDYPLISQAYGITPNIPIQSQASAHSAYFVNTPDFDAVIRWVEVVSQMNGLLMPSLGIKTAAEYLNRDIVVFFNNGGIESIGLLNREDESDVVEIPIDSFGKGKILLNHRGGREGFHHFSLADAYNNTFSKSEVKQLKDSILLMGATATGINDQRPNPFDSTIDGVEHHAAVVDNILKNNFMKRPEKIFKMELLIILGVGLLFSPMFIWGHALSSGLSVLAFVLGYYFVDHYFWFSKGIWVYMAGPYIEILSMFVSTTLVKYILEEKDKKFLKSAFSSYISPELIDEMHSSGQMPHLGGTSGIRTAYFTDIAGFSSFSEKLTAVQLVELLNEYLTAMTDILLLEKGTLDKYEGDAIIAFFGAPMDLPDHAIRACRVGVQMQDALVKLRKKWTEEGDKWPQIVKEMRMRIGINSGEIVTGNMGSRDRMNYTMMGDSVNLAARLEAAAKQYGIYTQISEYVVALIGDNFEVRELDTIRVVGKSVPVTTFDLLGIKGETSQNLIQLKESFARGLSLYKSMKWDEATEAFTQSLEFEYKRYPELKGKKTNPSEIYLERCKEFKAAPPPSDWDGVYTLSEK